MEGPQDRGQDRRAGCAHPHAGFGGGVPVGYDGRSLEHFVPYRNWIFRRFAHHECGYLHQSFDSQFQSGYDPVVPEYGVQHFHDHGIPSDGDPFR